MGLFGFGRKDKVLDLTEKYKRDIAQAEMKKAKECSGAEGEGNGPFSFFDSPDATGTDSADSDTPEEKKRKLAKRIADMTDKMEDLNNQVYHLQQRLEVLERKNDIRRT